jgi:gluconolactonase
MKNWFAAALVVLTIAYSWLVAEAAVDIVATGFQFTEGTIFVERSLYFVDYAGSDVFRLDGDSPRLVWHQDGCGANGLVRVPSGLLVACYDNGTVVMISLAGRALETISQDDEGRHFASPNDLAGDAEGGVYFSASGSATVGGKVFYRSPRGSVREVANGIKYSNGLVVSLDGTSLYVAESGAHRLLRYTIGADGTLSNKRVFADLNALLGGGSRMSDTPDAVRIDRRGRLFVGLYDGGGFAVIASDGRLTARVRVPGPHHASLAISPDGAYVYGTTVYDVPGGYRGELYRTPNPERE